VPTGRACCETLQPRSGGGIPGPGRQRRSRVDPPSPREHRVRIRESEPTRRPEPNAPRTREHSVYSATIGTPATGGSRPLNPSDGTGGALPARTSGRHAYKSVWSKCLRDPAFPEQPQGPLHSPGGVWRRCA